MKRSGPELLNPVKKKYLYPKATRSEEDTNKEAQTYLEITTKGKKILPSCIKKYYGTVQFRKDTQKWRVIVQGDHKFKSAHFETKEEGETYLKELNIREQFPIKNIIYLYENEYYCLLTQNQVMKFSLEHLQLVEDHIWHALYDASMNGFYAITSYKENGKRKTHLKFHQLVYPNLKKGQSGDHKNRQTLDNTAPNLRVAETRTQALNRDIFANNTTGVKGVHMQGKRAVATWRDEDGKICRKAYSSLIYGNEAFNMAVALRKEKENLPHYKKALCVL